MPWWLLKIPSLFRMVLNVVESILSTRIGCAAVAAVLVWFWTDAGVRREWAADIARRDKEIAAAAAAEKARQDTIAETTLESARLRARTGEVRDAANEVTVKEIENAPPSDTPCTIPPDRLRRVFSIE